MKLLVIEGGKTTGIEGANLPAATPPTFAGPPAAADVHAEARRRIRLSGYDVWCRRALATGVAMPAALRHLKLQIAFSAEVLARLEPIPDDFRSDVYWPPG